MILIRDKFDWFGNSCFVRTGWTTQWRRPGSLELPVSPRLFLATPSCFTGETPVDTSDAAIEHV